MFNISIKPNWKSIRNIVSKGKIIGKEPTVLSKLNISKDFGLSMDYFTPFRLSYNNLPIDSSVNQLQSKNLIQSMVPTRLRRYRNLYIDTRDKNAFHLHYNHKCDFQQNVNDFRQETRQFKLIPVEKYNLKFHQLVGQIAALCLSIQPSICNMDISLHQVRSIAYPQIEADNAPEGIHRDGADFIVSACIFNRHNILGATSKIYDTDKSTLLLETELEMGDMIFQDDKHLWHDITPIRSNSNYLGYRDILGFDIKINE